MKSFSLKRKIFASLLFSSLLISNNAFASGYYILDQSLTGTQNAFSTNVTGNGDGSEAYYNPAAMSEYQCTTASANTALIDLQARFNNINSTDAHGRSMEANSKNAGTVAAVPSAYWVAPISQDWTAGFGFNVPYGMSVKYDKKWYGRYQADDTDLRIYSFSPALSYKVTNNFSLGGSVGVHYGQAAVSNSIDFGTIGERVAGEAVAHSMGLSAQQNDGYADLEADSWATNYTIGALYNYGKENKNKVGIAYKSKTAFDLHGNAKFTVPDEAKFLQQTGSFVNGGVGAHLTMPEHISTGVRHWITDRFSLQAEVDWLRWSRFEELRFYYSTNQADSVVEEDWHDTFRYSLGGTYKLTDNLDYSLGYMYDQSPVRISHRTPRIPDNDRHLFGTGLTYKINKNFDIGASYTYVLVDDATITSKDSVGNTLNGSYDLGIQVVGVGVTYHF